MTFARSMIGRVVRPGLVSSVRRRNCPAIIRIHGLSIVGGLVRTAFGLAPWVERLLRCFRLVVSPRLEMSASRMSAANVRQVRCRLRRRRWLRVKRCRVAHKPLDPRARPWSLRRLRRLSTTDGHFARLFNFVPFRHRHDDFARLAAVVAADDSVFGHPVDQPGAASVSDAECSLQ